MRIRFLFSGILLASTMFTASAMAGPAEDKAAADTLFRDGRALVKQGNYADACPKLEASQNLDPTVGTLLALGDCYELAGKTASAWATFNDAQMLAKKREDKRREPETVRRANLVEPKLSKLTIEMATENRIPGLEVKRNGKTLDAALFGSALPVDPGEQFIEVTAPGKQPWSSRVQVEPKPGLTTVRIPKLEAMAPAVTEPPKKVTLPVVEPGKTDPSSDQSTVGITPVKPDHPTSSWSTQKTVGLVVGGVGVVGVALGSIAGVATFAQMSEVREQKLCTDGDPAHCTDHGVQKIEDAKVAANISSILFGAGGAALVAGIVIFATAPKKQISKTKTSLVVSPMVGPALTGLSFQGAF